MTIIANEDIPLQAFPPQYAAAVQVDAAPAPGWQWDAVDVSAHCVQFYDSDASLASSVGNFIASGFAAEENGVVIATAPHRRLFAAQLRALGVDVAAARAQGRYSVCDAATT